MAMLGIGHPNLILYTDYAELKKGSQPTWYLKVETHVDIEDGEVQMVKDGLVSSDPKVRKALAQYLHKRVPAGGGKPDASKRMISAALEVAYP
jgi:hypothetical protein